MVNWRSISRSIANKVASGATTNSYNLLSARALRIEQFEDRKMFDIGAAGPDLIAIIPNEGAVIQEGQILNIAPRELLFRFEDGSVINSATLGGIEIVRAGGDNVFGDVRDATVPIGFVGIGENPNEVIVRFAETLPDDRYRITIKSGTGGVTGTVPGRVGEQPFNGGTSLSRTFELDLGAKVVAVVPQPVVRGQDGKLTQQTDTVHVYFNDDDLNLTAAQNVNFYELIRTNDTATNLDDVIIRPISAQYSANSNAPLGDPGDRVVLKFNPSDLGPGTYRLRVGNNDPLPVAPLHQSYAPDTTPANTSFITAQGVGSLGTAQGLQSLIIDASIDPQNYTLQWPGSPAEPGHRNVSKPGEDHVGVIGDNSGGIPTLFYNFQDVYGADPFGNLLHNVITEEQKERTREIFGFFSRYMGVQFVETDAKGLTIATGDLRAVSRTVPTGPGGVAGIAGGTLAVMDNAEDWGISEFGGGWFRVAMHEIGHLLGLNHAGDLPDLTLMQGSIGGGGEPSFPGEHDITHGRYLFRPDSKDIDLYRFDLAQRGTLQVETLAERLAGLDSTSQLDSVITIYNQDKELIARNDDYFSQDSFLELRDLPAGTYYVAVTSKGNTAFDPNVEDSGMGGTTQGRYDLRLNFTPAPSTTNGIRDTTGQLLDGDDDGRAGGVFDFWFRTQQNQGNTVHNIIVDKAANPLVGTGPLGSITNPYLEIDQALADAEPGDIVRIVGNGVVPQNGQPDTRLSYNIGTDVFGNALSDGRTMEIPQGVTVMIDAGALIKLRGANITAGTVAQGTDRSEGALQVLGTPTTNAAGQETGRVIFTSFNDDTIGQNPDQLVTSGSNGDWGGLVFAGDSDREAKGIFLNSVNHADIRFGGGQVVVNSVQQVYNPIHMASARPAVSHNIITRSADAGMSADPNSFKDEEFQDDNFTADYRRIGPDVHDNRLTGNSINGLFVRIRTESGQSLDQLTVPARFDDTDITHVIAENLVIHGSLGGPREEIDPDTGFTTAVRRLDARLAIDPGTVVKLSGARIEASLSGQFIAEGTAENRIIFTSTSDDKYGAGGTFNTGNDPVTVLPAPGDWGGLYIGHVSSGSIDHALISYGGGSTTVEGGFDRFNAVEIHQADVRITNTALEFNDDGNGGDRAGRGPNVPATIFVRGAQPTVLNNIIRHNNGPAISTNVNALNHELVNDRGRSTGRIDLLGNFYANQGPLIDGNRLEDNAINGMIVRGGTVNVESVWDDTDIVHVVQDEIVAADFHVFSALRLKSSNSESLVVKLAGATAGFTAFGRPLEINDRIGGTVQIIGTAGHPVVLTSLADDTVGAGFTPSGDQQVDTDNSLATAPAAGNWRSIEIQTYANDRNVQVINELEEGFTSSGDTNDLPSKAQFIGMLAPNEKSGDDNVRLGFQIHGALSQAFDPTLPLPQRNADVDVYSFQAKGNTEVWIDIDRTTAALDTVIEVVDAAGSVVARSNNSPDELINANQLFGSARTMRRGEFSNPDWYTTNVKDAGLRIVLPGSATQNNTYFVRVRSNSTDLNNLTAGVTAGTYQIQVRLRETDEVPGTTVRYADIRYATNGIEVYGKPSHSPILGEVAEALAGGADNNDSFANAQTLGNLLSSDRGTLSVAGELATATDIDWYQFDLQYDLVQIIGNSSGEINPLTWATIFDIDYADGMSRADTGLAVFDQFGELIYIGRDSNVDEDQPGPAQGADTSNLNRGSFGKLDPYIGSVHLNEGQVEDDDEVVLDRKYYVAVYSAEQLPEILNATFQANAANPLVRLEPIDSTRTIVQDRIGTQGGGAFGSATTSPLFTPTSLLTLNAHADPFHLGDVPLFVNTLRDVVTVDGFTGRQETDLSGNGFIPGTSFVNHFFNDIAMRNDGRLFTLRDSFGNPPRDADTGDFEEINTGDGSLTLAGEDNVLTFQNVTQGMDTGIHYQGLTYDNGPHDGRRLFAIGWRHDGVLVGETRNMLIELNPNTGARVEGADPSVLPWNINAVPQNARGGFVIPDPRLVAVAATDTSRPFDRHLVDGMLFTIDASTFEIEMGPEVRFAPDANGLQQFRDGDTFILNGGVFEFDSGPVLVAQDASSFQDGDQMTLTDGSGVSTTFEFDNNGTVGGGRVRIPFVAGASANQMAQIIANTVNANTDIQASRGTGSNRVSLANVDDALMAESSGGLQLEGNDGVAANRVAVPFEETFTQDEMGNAIAASVNGAVLVNVDAFYMQGRINFDGATTFDFSGTPAFQYVATTDAGVTGTNVPVRINVESTATEVAQAIAAAVNALNILPPAPDATVEGSGNNLVRLADGNTSPLVRVAVGLGTTPFTVMEEIGNEVEGDPAATPPVFPAVNDEDITGIAVLANNRMFGVTETGSLYEIIGYRGLLSARLVSVSALHDPTTNLPINFSGLTAGPKNVEGGKYANMLFGTDDTGNIYAFDMQGNFQPVFKDGTSMISTGVSGALGLAFSPMDYNLWHVSGRRDDEVGHGLNVTPDNSRIVRTEGNRSFYFGIENPDNNPVTVQPNADNWRTRSGTAYNNYDMPGGAYGAITTNEFSLKGYSASDKPTMYFNYFLDTEDAVSGRGNLHDRMRDAFRVKISTDGANWTTLTTNNSLLSTASDVTELPRHISDSGGLYKNERLGFNDQHIQDTFDNTDSWRQARVDLGDWAGIDNLQLRFEFTTAGSFNVGDITTTGQTLSAVPGNELYDGYSFTITTPGPTPVSQTFEFDMGPSLLMPNAAGHTIGDGESFLVIGPGGAARFEFNKNGAVADGNVAVPINAAMSAAEVANAVRGAVNGAALGVLARQFNDRLQIEGATSVDVIDSPSIAAAGAAGGAGALIPVHVGMTEIEVAKAMADVIDATFANRADRPDDPTHYSSVKLDRNRLQIINYSVSDPGPLLGLATTSKSNQFGDFMGTERSRQRGQDNIHEGVYIDDIVIGFAERGEMVTSAGDNSNFFTPPEDPLPPGTEILRGEYQLEVRRGTDYGQMTGAGRLLLTQSFDTNDRLAQGITILAPHASQVSEGQTFSLNDGVNRYDFEFDTDGVLQQAGPNQPARIRVDFRFDSTEEEIADSMIAAINGVDRANRPFKVRAGRGPTGNKIVLTGAVDTDLQAANLNPPPPVGGFEADTITDAEDSGLTSATPGTISRTGTIGNEATGNLDVDMISFQLNVGDTVFIDVDMTPLSPGFDSLIRIFDQFGNQLAVSDDNPAPGEPPFTLEAYLAFTAPFSGTFYLGMSGFPNFNYDPLVAGSGTSINNAVGNYAFTMTLDSFVTSQIGAQKFDFLGDTNLFRDQGYLLLHGNQISDAAEWGILVDADQRGVNNSQPHPGAPRNLRQAALETAGLVPGITITNNLLVENGSGGIRFSGDDLASPQAPLLFGRIMNNTIFGDEGGTLGVGIQIDETASPTVLNNILANLVTGIEVGAGSASSVIGYNIYQGNSVNLVGDTETGATALLVTEPLFIDAEARNFYLVGGSKAIDSSVNSLPERPELADVLAPLGIPQSPILAPELDLLGQLRVDDPTVASPPGLGSNVFKDRGALDRADFAGPLASLVNPGDNVASGSDKDARQNFVQTSDRPTNFQVQFIDQGGSGIDDTTTQSNRFVLRRNGVVLQETTDYLYRYDATNNIARFDAAAGVWLEGNYTIEVVNIGQGVKDIAGNFLLPNEAQGKTIFTIALTTAVAAGSWQNPNNPLDVNNDNAVVGLDALIVINALNNLGNGSPVLPTPAPTPPPFYYDVNGDGTLTPLDALIIINFLNNPQAQGLVSQSLVASNLVESADDSADELSFALSVDSAPRGTFVLDSGVQSQASEARVESRKSVGGKSTAPVLAAEALEEAVAGEAWSLDDDELDDVLSDIADELHESIAAGSSDLWN